MRDFHQWLQRRYTQRKFDGANVTELARIIVAQNLWRQYEAELSKEQLTPTRAASLDARSPQPKF